MKKLSNAELAKRIAQKLLTVNGPDDKDVICTRAQLMLKNGSRERDMGGRNETSIINCILGELYSHR